MSLSADTRRHMPWALGGSGVKEGRVPLGEVGSKQSWVSGTSS